MRQLCVRSLMLLGFVLTSFAPEAQAVDLASARLSVVSVNADSESHERTDQPMIQLSGGRAALKSFLIQSHIGATSGFVLGEYVVTVLPRRSRVSDSFQVTWEDGQSQVAKRTAWHQSGLAILKLDESTGGLTLAESAPCWGQPAFTIYQFQPGKAAVASGVVSTDPEFNGAIGAKTYDLDVLVRPAAVGGPVLNDQGEVIGVVSAMRTVAESASTGIAIEIEAIRRLIDFAESGGTGAMPRPMLGVAIQMANGQVQASQVADGSPAEKAGIEPGDTVLELDGAEVDNAASLLEVINSKAPGSNIKVTILRGGEERGIEVVLGTRPDDSSTQPSTTVLVPDVADFKLQVDPKQLREALKERRFDLLEHPQPQIIGVPQDVRSRLKELLDRLNEVSEKVEQIQQTVE